MFPYLGIIGTGDLHSTFTDRAASTTDDTNFMWSLGLEGGIHLGLLQVGAEVGKMFGGAKGNPGAADLKLDGLYGKVLVGVGF